MPQFRPDVVLEFKKSILQLLEAGEVDNLSQAAEYLGISKFAVYQWKDSDPEWNKMVKQVDQLRADDLEKKLDKMNNPVGLIFRLKKLRPEYRDTFKIDVKNEALEKLLTELKNIGEKSSVPKQGESQGVQSEVCSEEQGEAPSQQEEI